MEVRNSINFFTSKIGALSRISSFKIFRWLGGIISFSTVFLLYQNDGRKIMTGTVQWKAKFGMESHFQG